MPAFYELRNTNGMRAVVCDIGARLVSLFAKDINDQWQDVVMGFDNPEDYLPENHLSDFGAVVGRYANRLAGGRINVGGKEYLLPQNDGPNCLHGGPRGWQYSIYDVLEKSDDRIVMSMVSPDGDNGFPGTVKVRVTYTLDDVDALRVDYFAETDEETVINMTNHSYFNLNGTMWEVISIGNHWLHIDADRFLPVDDNMIPTGEFIPVVSTPYDFRNGRQLLDVFYDCYEPVMKARGIDHCFVLNHPGDLCCRAARVRSPYTHIVMDVHTTEPGIQIYTGNFLDGVKGKNGKSYEEKTAICLETQQYPDSPNRQWPESTGRLLPGKPYQSTTIFKFSLFEHGL